MFKPGDLVECVEDSKWPKDYGERGKCYLVVRYYKNRGGLELAGVTGEAWAIRFKLFDEVNK